MKDVQTISDRNEILEIINGLAKLKVPDLEWVTNKLLAILEAKKSPDFKNKEKELIEKIKNCGPSESVLQRREELLGFSFQRKMTEAEHQEYKKIAEIMQDWALERTQLMSELAQLRGSSLKDVVKSLNLEPRSVNYA